MQDIGFLDGEAIDVRTAEIAYLAVPISSPSRNSFRILMNACKILQDPACGTQFKSFSKYGLQRINCKTGNYVVITVERRQYCAFPTAQYPAGVYRLDPNTPQIYALGEGPTNGVDQPTVQPPPPPVTGYPPTTGYPTTGYPPATGYPSTIPAVGGTGIPVAQPNIVDNYNPYNPVPSAVEIHIRGMLAKRGINLASCNQTPLTVFTIGRYTACAYPSINYPVGRYQVDANLPF